MEKFKLQKQRSSAKAAQSDENEESRQHFSSEEESANITEKEGADYI